MVVSSNMFSGLENVAFTIINNLKNNFNFVYVTQNGPIIEFLKEYKINYYIIDKMNVYSINKMIKDINPDIIHAHDYRASFICSISCNQIPLISHIHNNSPWIKRMCPNSFAFLYSSLRSQVVLTVSDSIKNEYIFSNLIKNKIKCINNPVSINKIIKNVTNDDYIKKYDICCVGRLTQQKNPFRFLEIIKMIKTNYPNVKAIWVGDGELLNAVKIKCDELSLNENINFVGFKKNPYKYMACSKVFMLTSDWEGYGLVAFEALSLGLPCVVSNVGGLVNIVDDTCGKLCNNNDDYVNKSVTLLTDNKIYKAMSKNALIKAKRLDNLTEYINIILKQYNDILN